jgi:osmoprotectant transport system permease protein
VEFILNHPSEFLKLLLQHLRLVGYAGGLCIIIGIPLGILLTRPRFERFVPGVLSVVNIGQTVPSLAIIGLSMGFLGLGVRTAVFALVLYGLLPVVRNTLVGISNVEPAMIETAQGMGMTEAQVLFRIQLPLAARVIMAGVRTSIVINTGSAALAFLIAGGGLGDLIFTGMALMDYDLLLAGAVPTAALAVLLDYILGFVEHHLVPAGIR